jgi:hypothetical protein
MSDVEDRVRELAKNLACIRRWANSSFIGDRHLDELLRIKREASAVVQEIEDEARREASFARHIAHTAGGLLYDQEEYLARRALDAAAIVRPESDGE